MEARYPIPCDWRPRDHRSAPLVDRWELVLDGDDVRLRGVLEGGRYLETGPLQAWSEAEGWAWTGTSTYRLARPRRDVLDI